MSHFFHRKANITNISWLIQRMQGQHLLTAQQIYYVYLLLFTSLRIYHHLLVLHNFDTFCWAIIQQHLHTSYQMQKVYLFKVLQTLNGITKNVHDLQVAKNLIFFHSRLHLIIKSVSKVLKNHLNFPNIGAYGLIARKPIILHLN